MRLKVKLWIENEDENLVFGDGKNLVLQYLDSTSSIEETAKELKMSEENVFKHLQILEDNNKEEMILRTQSLKKNSKASYRLTAEAREILQTYQIYQYDVKKFAQEKFEEFRENYKITTTK